MRGQFIALAALALCAVAAPAASAQTPLDCSVFPQTICENEDIRALEGERASLIQRIADLNPQDEALAREQAWLEGLRACDEDVECYRTAYLNHNEALKQSAPGQAAAPSDAEEILPPLELLPEEIPGEDEPAPRPRAAPDEVYADHAPNDRPLPVPGWGFFTALAIAFGGSMLLLRARKRVQAEIDAMQRSALRR